MGCHCGLAPIGMVMPEQGPDNTHPATPADDSRPQAYGHREVPPTGHLATAEDLIKKGALYLKGPVAPQHAVWGAGVLQTSGQQTLGEHWTGKIYGRGRDTGLAGLATQCLALPGMLGTIVRLGMHTSCKKHGI